MEFRCVKLFTVSRYDEDGFLLENNYYHIKRESTWCKEEISTLLDDEVFLYNIRGFDQGDWVVITKDMLNSNFRKIREINVGVDI